MLDIDEKCKQLKTEVDVLLDEMQTVSPDKTIELRGKISELCDAYEEAKLAGWGQVKSGGTYD